MGANSLRTSVGALTFAPARSSTSPPGRTLTLKPNLKPLVFLLCLVPLAALAWQGITGGLGANPVEAITHHTGLWALRLLMVTLALTPLRLLTGWSGALRYRRMTGLFAFFYALLHFLTYLGLDQQFAWGDIATDILERPYITVGFAALVILVPLAATSTNAMVRRLGARRWLRLHRLVYVSGLLGALHFLWLVKADIREPVLYLALFVILMVLRAPTLRRFLPGAAAGRSVRSRGRTDPQM